MWRAAQKLVLALILVASLLLAIWSVGIFVEPRLAGLDGVLGDPIFICPPSFSEFFQTDTDARRIWSGGFTLIGSFVAFASARSLLRGKVNSS